MRQHLRFSLLTVAAVFWLTPSSLRAECQNIFPGGYVPFLSIYYISDPNDSGDRLVVGRMTIDAFRRLQEVPLPDSTDQKFCNQIELAPGFFADAYVPTAAERNGHFEPFGGLLLDPLVLCAPFAFQGVPGIIPPDRLPDVFAWRIPSPDNSAPLLEIKMNKVCYVNGDTVTATSYRLANPTAGTVAIELKVWQGFPGGNPMSYDNRGFDGSLQLPAGFDQDSGPFDLFTVTPDLPRGTYEFSSRVLDWVTGKQLSIRRNLFLIP